jgi:hypothetical protein
MYICVVKNGITHYVWSLAMDNVRWTQIRSYREMLPSNLISHYLEIVRRSEPMAEARPFYQ